MSSKPQTTHGCNGETLECLQTGYPLQKDSGWTETFFGRVRGDAS